MINWTEVALYFLGGMAVGIAVRMVVDEHLRCLELLRAEIKERFEKGERPEDDD